MIAPQLTPSEIACVKAAKTMDRVDCLSGSCLAVDGREVLFASGGAESFDALWRQALAIREGRCNPAA